MQQCTAWLIGTVYANTISYTARRSRNRGTKPDLETVALGEAERTHVTCIRFLSRVRPHVSLEFV